MAYSLYRALVTLVCVALTPLALPLCLTREYWRRGLRQRLGLHLPPRPRVADGSALVWLHAASIGEVRAAAVLTAALEELRPGLAFAVSTTTERGRLLAGELQPPATACFLAPLDHPWIVRRSLRHMRPDLFVNIETELWPVMLHEAGRQGVPLALVNARLSARSLRRYKRLGALPRKMLEGFSLIVASGQENARRYLELGAPPERMRVEGNLKFDLAPGNGASVRQQGYRRRLDLTGDMAVLLCGSTHGGEEEELLRVFQATRRERKRPLLLILAPRHLERLLSVQEMCERRNISYDVFSRLKPGSRRHDVVLLDTMGELADLYGVADHVFCGGSLVAKGGHNPLEAARWGRPVHYGPHMEDFRDMAELLEEAGAGFPVADAAEVFRSIQRHMADPEGYRTSCARARDVAMAQQGSALRQARHVLELLRHHETATGEQGA